MVKIKSADICRGMWPYKGVEIAGYVMLKWNVLVRERDGICSGREGFRNLARHHTSPLLGPRIEVAACRLAT